MSVGTIEVVRPRFNPSQRAQQKLTTAAIARRAAEADGVTVLGEAVAGERWEMGGAAGGEVAAGRGGGRSDG
jgi:hypothetical protein